ncbi:hypothetical protein [Flavobacterium hercynium]|uniref:Copper homeostasis protein n=1 Tax=Flavobacterium hercynium TaxID=387094 RepID=A0A226GWX5_9FLAO|nr:hypothetical protein [Flavobacterium hercynium]OXA86435.1 hypothetical protein B0A66_18080 [Flavobacterium hercynium]
MKKVLTLMTVILTVLISCKKETTPAPPAITPDAPKEAEIAEPAGDECYVSTANDIKLSFNINSHQEVNGKLFYGLKEKDKNEGTLIGNIKGDTLIADYTFMSEGVSSIREVVFLHRENTYIEGYGDIVETNNKVSFKNRKNLKFDATNVLTKVDCDK